MRVFLSQSKLHINICAYLTTLASYKLWAAYLISITLGGPGLTWSRLDIEVNGISCSALRITRCAFIATVIGRCHVRDDQFRLPGQKVNHLEILKINIAKLSTFLFDLEFREWDLESLNYHVVFEAGGQPLASNPPPVEGDVGHPAGLAHQPHGFPQVGSALVRQWIFLDNRFICKEKQKIMKILPILQIVQQNYVDFYSNWDLKTLKFICNEIMEKSQFV